MVKIKKRPSFVRPSVINRPLSDEELLHIRERMTASSLFSYSLRKHLGLYLDAENQALTHVELLRKREPFVGTSNTERVNSILKKLNLNYGIRSIKYSRLHGDGSGGTMALRPIVREGHVSKIPLVEREDT